MVHFCQHDKQYRDKLQRLIRLTVLVSTAFSEQVYSNAFQHRLVSVSVQDGFRLFVRVRETLTF